MEQPAHGGIARPTSTAAFFKIQATGDRDIHRCYTRLAKLPRDLLIEDAKPHYFWMPPGSYQQSAVQCSGTSNVNGTDRDALQYRDVDGVAGKAASTVEQDKMADLQSANKTAYDKRRVVRSG
jgi:hypothetical protein